MSRTATVRVDSWADLMALAHSPIHVVGAGSVEGAHLLLFLLDHGFERLVGHDFSDGPGFDRAFKRVHVGWPMAQREAMLERLRRGVELRFRDRYLEGIEEAAVIAVTQGWYLYEANARLLESSDLQARFISLVELYLALAPGPVVGVSGSHGKSTTTHLVADMLRAAGREVIQAGNDRHGQQALGLLEAAGREAHLVLEISNRHLKMLDRSPNVAVLTNVHPNHLEEHGGWDGYVEAKSRLFRFQAEGDIAVLNADLEVTRAMADAVQPGVRLLWFGERAPAATGVQLTADRLVSALSEPGLAMPIDAIPLAGQHNAANVAAAAAAALGMGVPAPDIERAVRAFRGLKHRLQLAWRTEAGVGFYDDLNSTTPTATTAALRTLGGEIVWILGGDDKGLDATELAAAARACVETALLLPGPGGERIGVELERAGVRLERVPDLGTAVSRAVAIARPGASVLLSPACPGFFTRYYVGANEDTGFKQLVKAATLGRA